MKGRATMEEGGTLTKKTTQKRKPAKKLVWWEEMKERREKAIEGLEMAAAVGDSERNALGQEINDIRDVLGIDASLAEVARKVEEKLTAEVEEKFTASAKRDQQCHLADFSILANRIAEANGQLSRLEGRWALASPAFVMAAFALVGLILHVAGVL